MARWRSGSFMIARHMASCRTCRSAGSGAGAIADVLGSGSSSQANSSSLRLRHWEVRVLTSARLAGIHPEMEPYFRDVGDHLARVADKVEGFDALLTDILTANLAQISILQNEESKQQNEDTRRISAWVAIVAVNTIITGVYGMNFDNMPELHTRYGYFVVIALMLIIDVALYRRFRRSGWL